MISASRSSAQRSSSARRSALSTTPVGNWCAGVSSTARASSGSSSTTIPALVHPHRHRLEPALGEQPADPLVPRVLDRQLHRPERLGDRHERLSRARAQDHVLAARDRPAHPPAVRRQHLAQRRRPGDRRVVELGDPGAAHRGAERPDPVRAREAREVRPPGPQVVADRRADRLTVGADRHWVRRPLGVGATRGDDAGRDEQPALGGELHVGVAHDAARDAEVGRQRA